QRSRARNRHRRASRCGRGERTHHCGDRLWIVKVVSTGEPWARGKNSRRKRGDRFRIFHGDRTRSTNFPYAQSNHCWLETRRSRGGSWVEQRRAHHGVTSTRT